MPCFEGQKSLNGYTQKPKQKPEECGDCNAWRGRCEKGKRNKIAIDPACEDFEPKSENSNVSSVQYLRTCGVALSSTLPKGDW